MQYTLSTYASSCWIALTHLHWIQKNRAILNFSLDWKPNFLFIGYKYDGCKAVSVLFSGLAQTFLLKQSVDWFTSVKPSLVGENPLIKVYHTVGWLEQKENDLCLWQWILHEPSLPSLLFCYDRWMKRKLSISSEPRGLLSPFSWEKAGWRWKKYHCQSCTLEYIQKTHVSGLSGILYLIEKHTRGLE